MSLLFKNARVMDPASGLDGRRDVLVEGEKIVAVEPMIPEPAQAGVIDCTGKVLVPGLLDMHCHLR